MRTRKTREADWGVPMDGDSNALTASITVRFTERDLDLLRSEGAKLGFSTTGSYLREVVLRGLGKRGEGTVHLETLLRMEFLVAECFKTFAPDPSDVAKVEGLQRRAEAVSGDLLKGFLSRRGEAPEGAEETHGA